MGQVNTLIYGINFFEWKQQSHINPTLTTYQFLASSNNQFVDNSNVSRIKIESL